MAELEFDFSDVDDAQLDGANWVDREGEFVVMVTKVDDSFTTDERAILVDMQVVSGTPMGQEGRLHRERFYATPKAMSRIAAFAVACGLATRDQVKRQKVAIDLARAVGRRVLIKIVGDQYTDKDGNPRTAYKCDYLGFYPVPSSPSAAPAAVPAARPVVASSTATRSPYADL